MSAQSRAVLVDGFGRVKAWRVGLVSASHHRPDEHSFLPIYSAYGDDHRGSLQQFYRGFGPQVQRMLGEMRHLVGTRLYLVADGALLAAQIGCNTQQCPCCLRGPADYIPNPGPSPELWRAAGVRGVSVQGIGFVDPFSRPTSMWSGMDEFFPPERVVWAPNHCFAHAFSFFFDQCSDVLDRTLPGRSLTWLQEVSSASGVRNTGARPLGRGVKLSWEEARHISRAQSNGRIPPSGHAMLDEYFERLVRMYDNWTHCISPRLFRVDAGLNRALHLQLFNNHLKPSIHCLFDHLPAQWMANADADPFFPHNVSEETGEKSHKAFKAAWMQSVMTVLAHHTAENGLAEVMRASMMSWLMPWFPRTLCLRDPAYV